VKDVDALASPVVPASSAATDGATAGSLGDCSMADLQRGYCPYSDESEGNDYDGDTYAPTTAPQGFLGAPNPYIRDYEP